MLFNVGCMNVLGIRSGDIVEIIMDAECEISKDRAARKIRAVVVETAKRWFRVYVKCRKGGYFTCVNYVATYMSGKRLIYKVIKRRL